MMEFFISKAFRIQTGLIYVLQNEKIWDRREYTILHKIIHNETY